MDLLNNKYTHLRVETDETGGFVQPINHMGDDRFIYDCARISYLLHESEPRSDEEMLRRIDRLLKSYHTSPFENGSIVWVSKMPIFVARQLHRHRTGKYNESSMRFKPAKSGYWLPSSLREQSVLNKHLSSGLHENSDEFITEIESVSNQAFNLYNKMIDAGVAREQARAVLPMSSYTHMTINMDVHNLMKFLRLRTAPDAQAEIRELALGMEKALQDLFPGIHRAFEHYWRDSVSIPRSEWEKIVEFWKTIEKRHKT